MKILLLLVATSIQTSKQQTPAPKGQNATSLEAFPFFAQLVIRIKNATHESAFGYGGALIHSEWVITAAYCFLKCDAQHLKKNVNVTVIMGTLQKIGSDGPPNWSRKIICHPNYLQVLDENKQIETLENDVAVVELIHPYVLWATIQIAFVPVQNTLIKPHSGRCRFGTVVGIGTVAPGTAQYALQYAEMRSYAPDELIAESVSSSGTIFYTVANFTDRYPFLEESGNPFICYEDDNGNKIPVLFGIGSWFLNDNHSRTTVYEEVDRHATFIFKHVDALQSGNSYEYDKKRFVSRGRIISSTFGVLCVVFLSMQH